MKKKILTLTLAAVLMLTLVFSLTSCGSAKTFTVDNFSIELNSMYFDLTSAVPVGEEVETFAAYISLIDGLIVIPTKAPNPNNEFSLYRYVNEYARQMGGSISEKNGVPTVTYSQESDGTSFSVEAYIYEDDNAIWVVAFMALNGDISEKSDLIAGYVETIVIE